MRVPIIGDPDLANIQARLDETPLHRWLDLEIIGLDREDKTLTIRMPIVPARFRADGIPQVHGGIIASVIDTAAAFCAAVYAFASPVTVGMNVQYLAAATGDSLVAIASLRRSGRSLAFVEISVMGDGAVAHGSCVLFQKSAR